MYVDETIIIAELKKTVLEKSEKGLYLNSSKSFTMVFSTSIDTMPCGITVYQFISGGNV